MAFGRGGGVWEQAGMMERSLELTSWDTSTKEQANQEPTSRDTPQLYQIVPPTETNIQTCEPTGAILIQTIKMFDFSGLHMLAFTKLGGFSSCDVPCL